MAGAARAAQLEFIARTLEHQGTTRTYFLGLPDGYDVTKSYWPLVIVHGGGGNPRSNARVLAFRRMLADQNFPAILIAPEFVTTDKQVSRFPALGEDAFLKAVLAQVRSAYRVHPKILLTGYSMGGQFAHRFAFANPDLVQACAPFAAGTWTTPDRRLLIEGFGEVKDVEAFLSRRENTVNVPERLHDLFDERTVSVAGLPPAAGAPRVPFLVMCGTLDPRHSIAVEFAESLKEAGFVVRTGWPATPHGSSDPQFAAEYDKFPESALRFFREFAAGNP
ncbi:MAG: hypothetical protein KF861_04835 [Planctomycetaceae bacterium]|nr:hypothetical protein [Planctomycetaceae bacterium]